MAKWTPQQVAVMCWLNMGEEERVHKTQTELCDYLGISINQPANWSKLPGWQKAKEKAAWLVMEQTNNVTLIKTRRLIKSAETLKDMADHYRWVLPLVMKARVDGYFDDLEPDQEEEILPEVYVREELNKLPIEEQMHFVKLLEKLNYLKAEQAVVESDENVDILDGLMKPLEQQEKIYNNVPRRRSRTSIGRENPNLLKALPPATPLPKGRKRHYSGGTSKNIEL